MMDKTPRREWTTIVSEKKRLQRDAIQSFAAKHRSLIEVSSGIYTPDQDVAITVVTSVAAGRVSCAELVHAYCHRAILAHDQTNCLTEILFEDAIDRARQLDAHRETTGKTVGPLHGLIMTAKDQFDIVGYDSSIGYVGRCFQPAEQDSILVAILKELGANIIGKTNLPQSIMWCETENPLWGQTVNPTNPALTPGGSTGGEAALLAMGGSMVGWGTDIGGSIRIPSHMMGLYGLKPSSGRLPYGGVPVSTEGQEHVPSVVGPLACDLSSIHLVTKAVIDAEPWLRDSRAIPLPWREGVYQSIQTRPLVIGVLYDDGVVRVHPPILRVLQSIVRKLEQAGHTVIEWNADGHQECVEIMDQYYTADGGEDIKRDISAAGEPYIPHVAALVNRAPAISVYEYWQLNKRKLAAQNRYMQRWARSASPPDVLLTPTMPHTAVKHRSCRWVGYTKIWNFLDYSAIAIPAGKVDKEIDFASTDPEVQNYCPRNDLDGSNWALYDPQLMHELPVSVQIVGRRLEEEKILGAAQVIDTLIRS